MSEDSDRPGEETSDDDQANDTESPAEERAPESPPAEAPAQAGATAEADQPADEAAEEPAPPPPPELAPPDPTPASVPSLPADTPPPPADLPPPPGAAEEPDLPPPTSVPVPKPAPAPTVLPSAEVGELSPSHGPTIGGTKVTLDGKHLYRESIVRFGGELATTVGATVDRQLKVESPPRAKPGSVDVSIQNPGSDITVLEGAFQYEALPAPVITSVAPVRGAVAGGTELSVTGKNFVPGSVVKLGGIVAQKTAYVDSTTLEVTTPPGQAGKMIDVEVENPDGKRDQAPRAFLYDDRY